MTTLIRLAVCALVFALPAWLVLQAADLPAPPPKGRVLLLNSERILEGDIEKAGEQYRVHRATGGETLVPGDNVLRLCASREEAYEYLRERANLADPDEHLRLARWCQTYELRPQALVEVKAAATLRPEDTRIRGLLASLERAAAAPPAAPALPPVPVPVPAAPPPVDLSEETVTAFAKRVQPILMNTCAGCHNAEHPSFRLSRAFGDTPTYGKTVQQNLAAVLPQIRPEQPESSPLLVMAASIHGGAAQAPLKGRQTPAYRALEEWVKATVAGNPQLQRTRLAAAPAERETGNFAAGKAEPQPAKTSDPAPPASPPKPAEAQPAAPADEFDPLIFNRQMHPERKADGGM